MVSGGHEPQEYDHSFKFLIIGDSGVGKSSLLLQFTEVSFSPNYIATIGVDYKIRTISVDGQRIKLQIWDTAGQERFRTVTTAYFRGAHGVIVVYDVTSGESFSNVERWLQMINQNCNNVQKILGSDVVRISVGNKVDDPKQRTVAESDARSFAEQIGIRYFETSAKENVNVSEVFDSITKLTLDAKLRSPQHPMPGEPQSGSVQLKGYSRTADGGKKKKCKCG